MVSALKGKFEASSLVRKSCNVIVLNIKCAALKGWKDTIAIKCFMICNIFIRLE